MKQRAFRTLVSLLVLLAVASCVSIAGQRISWYHDAAKDSLKILIHYDGIHEGNGRSDKGADQLPKFVRDRDVLLLDWWGHLRLGALRAKLKTGNVVEKLIAATLTGFDVQAIGHYTDPGGRIGALQVITVPKVSRLVKSLNQMISVAVRAGQLTDPSYPKTLQLQREAAADRHEWIALDGHAIRLRFPVHPDEAGRFKARWMSRLVSLAFERAGEEHQALVRRVARQIAEAPVSVIHEEEMLTVVLGHKGRPCTVRITTRDDYNNQLEGVVKQNVSTDLDLRMAKILIERGESATGGAQPAAAPGVFGDLLGFGPPEDQVGALLQLAATARRGKGLPDLSADATATKAVRALQRFGKQWSDRGLWPRAPADSDDEEGYRQAWSNWYVAVTGRKPLDK
ncbi:MAG: hypothetical protein KDC87_22060 [Planctomycetes bacterium]|nr:hypothetical protein [Planctomycetota bacterium]